MTSATLNLTEVEQVGDYDLCFSNADLYQNRLMPDSDTEEAAKELLSVLVQGELDVQKNRLTEQEKVFDSLRESLFAKSTQRKVTTHAGDTHES